MQHRSPELLSQVDDLTADGRVVSEQELAAALQATEAAGRPELSARLHLRGAEMAHQQRDRPSLIAHLDWLGEALDASPDWMDWWLEVRALWVQRWRITDLLDDPQVPLASLEASHRAMAYRHWAHQRSDAPVRMCRYLIDAHTRGEHSAGWPFRVWAGESARSELSEDLHTEELIKLRHLRLSHGDKDEAEILARSLYEADPPTPGLVTSEWALMALTGQEPDPVLAADAFRESRWLTREVTTPLSLANQLEVLMRSGALIRAVNLLGDTMDATTVLDPFPIGPGLAELRLGAVRLGVLTAAEDLGMGDHRLISGDSASAITLQADLLRGWVPDRAARYDRRNGNITVSTWVQELIHPAAAQSLPVLLAGEPGEIPLEATELVQVNTHPFAAVLDDLDQLDLVGLHRRSMDVLRWGGEENLATVLAHWRTRRGSPQTASAVQTDPTARWARAELDYLVLSFNRSLIEPEEAEYQRVAEEFRSVGDEASALLVEQLRASTHQDVEAVIEAIRRIDECGTVTQRLRARNRLFRLSGPPAVVKELLADMDALVGDVSRLDPLARMCYVLQVRLNIDNQAPEQRIERITELLDALVPGEFPSARAELLSARGWLRSLVQDPDAEADLQAAVDTVREAGEPRSWVVALLNQSRMTADEQLATRNRRLVRWFSADLEMPEAGAEATLALAESQWETNLAESADLLAESLHRLSDERLPTVPDRRVAVRSMRAQLRRALAAATASLHEDAEAHALLMAALEDYEQIEDQTGMAQTHFELGEVLTGMDALAALREYDSASQLAAETGDYRLPLVVARERIQAVYNADGPDAALGGLAQARRSNEQLQVRVLTDPRLRDDLDWDFDIEFCELAEMQARVLGTADRPAAALAALQGLPDRRLELGDLSGSLRTRMLRAELLMDLEERDAGLAEFGSIWQEARRHGLPDLARTAALRGASRLEQAGDHEAAMAFYSRLSEPEETD